MKQKGEMIMKTQLQALKNVGFVYLTNSKHKVFI